MAKFSELFKHNYNFVYFFIYFNTYFSLFLHPLIAQSEGSIPMEEKEEFEVVELDQGDGWTRVRRANMEEGFVPTSYIECFLHNNC